MDKIWQITPYNYAMNYPTIWIGEMLTIDIRRNHGILGRRKDESFNL